jgi:hypothetical protein
MRLRLLPPPHLRRLPPPNRRTRWLRPRTGSIITRRVSDITSTIGAITTPGIGIGTTGIIGTGAGVGGRGVGITTGTTIGTTGNQDYCSQMRLKHHPGLVLGVIVFPFYAGSKEGCQPTIPLTMCAAYDPSYGTAESILSQLAPIVNVPSIASLLLQSFTLCRDLLLLCVFSPSEYRSAAITLVPPPPPADRRGS